MATRAIGGMGVVMTSRARSPFLAPASRRRAAMAGGFENSAAVAMAEGPVTAEPVVADPNWARALADSLTGVVKSQDELRSWKDKVEYLFD